MLRLSQLSPGRPGEPGVLWTHTDLGLHCRLQQGPRAEVGEEATLPSVPAPNRNCISLLLCWQEIGYLLTTCFSLLIGLGGGSMRTTSPFEG